MVAQTEEVEMEGVETVVDPETVKKNADLLAVQEIREHARQIDKAVLNKEPRFVLRVLRSLPNTRRKLNPAVLRSLVTQLYPAGAEREAILLFIEDLPVGSSEPEIPRPRAALKTPLPEVDAYFHLLILVRLIDTKSLEKAEKCTQELMAKVVSQNRRTLDLIAAKCYFYQSRVAELTNKLESVRSFLHSRLRTATLRNDFEGQAVIINCLLRNYLHYSLYDQADKLVNKSVFPETASNNEWARFLYYLGRIKAAKLEYSVAYKHLVQALRKAPQHAAVGFRQTAQKLVIVVELLLGDIPERQIFRQAALRRSLAPYFQLTQAVRMGKLSVIKI
jgi:26S proteasome regulatory subunit N3